MSEHDNLVNMLREANVLRAIERGEPAMSSLYNVFVVARDGDRIRLGGLGSLGVGEMWVDKEPRHEAYSGYRSAPYMKEDQ